MASKMQEPYVDTICPTCGVGKMQTPVNGQEWHVVCDECNAIMLCYDPLPHQALFHMDDHKIKMFAGGFGSGKTITGAMETIDHILDTPNGRTLIGAETLPQLEQTAMEEFFNIFPEELIESYSKQKNILRVKNGHTVIFRPLDEEQKARSLNLTFFWIEEANGVNFEYYVQLTTRLRNTATAKPRGILTTNPDMNWVKTEILLKADAIYNSDIDYHVKDEDKNPNISVHIAPTRLNIHLPPNYFEDTAKGRPDWWVRRYLQGSFENKEGLVFPMYADHLVDDFEIPRHWKRRIGGDFGLNNPTGFIALATDPETGVSYIYKEHKEAQKPVHYHAKILNENFLAELPYGVLETMVGDAAGQQKTAGNQTSVFDHYAEYGIYWNPSTKKLEDSILKMYSYFSLGKLKIFKGCKDFIAELSQYRYPERKLDGDTKKEDAYEKPIKKNDHLIDAARYIVAEMPDDPDQLINKSYNAQHVIVSSLGRKQDLPHALQENDSPSYSRSDLWMAY